MDSGQLPADACPICKKKALTWIGAGYTCESCRSTFEVDLTTKLCRYTYVATDNESLRTELTSTWLSRREVLDRTAAIPNGERAPVPATVKGVRVLWGVLIGTLALISMLCACLAAVLLSSSINNTRTIIATSNQAVQALVINVSVTSGTDLRLTASVLSPLNSPLATPVQANDKPTNPTAILTEPTGTPAESSTIVSSDATALVTTSPDTAATALPTLPGATQPPAATATLPPTFTPRPSMTIGAQTTQPPASPTTSPTALPTAIASATPVSTVSPIATTPPPSSVSPTPTITPAPTETVVLVTVHYTGTASLSWSDQYVEVVNHGQTRVSVGRWILRAQSSGRLFTFPSGSWIEPGQTCFIYSNSPPNNLPCGQWSFNVSTRVWSLTGDLAVLIDDDGNVISRYVYSND